MPIVVLVSITGKTLTLSTPLKWAVFLLSISYSSLPVCCKNIVAH
uniref:Uncharacterized protein n=1 Tax=Siphoviridae sp. ct8NQ14 TaxID=2825363 RepID=A0A8S5PLS1_9CAUD|nr:MAG TPA: hypothetical protein [Siphoviridae sp. ct8NQ14]